MKRLKSIDFKVRITKNNIGWSPDYSEETFSFSARELMNIVKSDFLKHRDVASTMYNFKIDQINFKGQE